MRGMLFSRKKKRNYLSMRCLQSSALCCTVFSSISHEKKLLTITMVNVEVKLRYFYYLVLKKFIAFSLIYSSLTQNILRSVKRVIRVVSYETLEKSFCEINPAWETRAMKRMPYASG